MVTIITNNQPRDLLTIEDLTDAERAEFEYLNWEEISGELRFFRYRGNVYDGFDMTPVDPHSSAGEMTNWGHYLSEGFFAGIVVRHLPDTDWQQIVVGRYTS